MKLIRNLLLVPIVMFAPAAFAQGKISWFNTGRLYVLGNALSSDPGGGGPIGEEGAIASLPLPSGIGLTAALYAGTNAGSLILVSAQTLPTSWATPGSVYLGKPSIPCPGGQLAFFQIFIYDSAFVDPGEALSAGSYYGTSGLFTAVPSSSIAYASLANTNAPVFSTWAPTNLVINTGGLTYPPSALMPQPPSQNAVSGSTVFITSNVTGVPPYTFQWYFGTNSIPDATNSVLRLTGIQTGQSGSYSFVVFDRFGSSNSPPATLNVVPGLEVDTVPLLTLKGDVGSDYSLEYINAIGPTNAWAWLATATITNNPQAYIDMSAKGQPQRFYRLVHLP